MRNAEPARRRVVHYLDATTYGGCEQVALTLLAGFDRERWEPVLFHHDGAAMSRVVAEANALGVMTRVLPRIARDSWRSGIEQFARALREVRPAIFHAHLGWPLGCRHGILAARIARVPFVVATMHLYVPLRGVRFASMKQWVQAAALDRYIAVSNEVGDRLVDELNVSGGKLRIVPNGIRLSLAEPGEDAEFRASLGGTADCPLVLTAARLHSQKGHDFLLQAAANVPNAIFLLAGDGPERERLEREAARLGLQERVRFLGHRHDVARLLAHCDLFVLPSLYEGLPLTVLEAMAAGKPVIATAVGGTDEAILDGVSGRLVPPGDAAALGSAINALLADRQSTGALAKAGLKRVRTHFSAEAMVRGVEQVYQEMPVRALKSVGAVPL